MAKPNYSFEKRQREIAKKKKQDEKLAKKQAAKGPDDHSPGQPADQGAPGEPQGR
ncbi:MAG: hypothetical protein M3Q40_05845 [Pseudomonadota bacterium]|nr:hypothetical protein [Pseudomonadota bacterium]